MNHPLIKSLAVILFLFIPVCCYSQTIHGKILDSGSQSPIGYVNVGIIGKNVGTVSDDQGNFTITLDRQYDRDTLKFSMIGFQGVQFEIGEFKKSFLYDQGTIEIKLDKKVTTLKEVIIRPEISVTKIIGNTAHSNALVGGFSSNDLGSELGTVMKIKKSPVRIDNVNFNIAVNKYDSVTFRVNIYKMYKGKPAENVLNTPIFVTTKIRRGTLTVDLKPYNLIAEDDFFVSIEWIQNLKGDQLYFNGGLLNHTSYSRKTSQGSWKKAPIGLGFYTTVTYQE